MPWEIRETESHWVMVIKVMRKIPLNLPTNWQSKMVLSYCSFALLFAWVTQEWSCHLGEEISCLVWDMFVMPLDTEEGRSDRDLDVSEKVVGCGLRSKPIWLLIPALPLTCGIWLLVNFLTSPWWFLYLQSRGDNSNYSGYPLNVSLACVKDLTPFGCITISFSAHSNSNVVRMNWDNVWRQMTWRQPS
jgi:hypothetical protein